MAWGNTRQLVGALNTANGWYNAPELHAGDRGMAYRMPIGPLSSLHRSCLHESTHVLWRSSTLPSSSARATIRLLGSLEERCKLGNLPCSAVGLHRPLGPAC